MKDPESQCDILWPACFSFLSVGGLMVLEGGGRWGKGGGGC